MMLKQTIPRGVHSRPANTACKHAQVVIFTHHALPAHLVAHTGLLTPHTCTVAMCWHRPQRLPTVRVVVSEGSGNA
eukprot:1160883-Pelagomonas_calceolata.AAC.10